MFLSHNIVQESRLWCTTNVEIGWPSTGLLRTTVLDPKKILNNHKYAYRSLRYMAIPPVWGVGRLFCLSQRLYEHNRRFSEREFFKKCPSKVSWTRGVDSQNDADFWKKGILPRHPGVDTCRTSPSRKEVYSIIVPASSNIYVSRVSSPVFTTATHRGYCAWSIGGIMEHVNNTHSAGTGVLNDNDLCEKYVSEVYVISFWTLFIAMESLLMY